MAVTPLVKGQDQVRPPSSALQAQLACVRLQVVETVDAEDCSRREAAIAWIVANQLGRRNLTPSQKEPLGIELKKQLAAEAKKRMLAAQNNNAGRAAQERIPELEKGKASEQAAEMLGINPHYVTDAKKIEQDAQGILDNSQSAAPEPNGNRLANHIYSFEPRLAQGDNMPLQCRWIFDGRSLLVNFQRELGMDSQDFRRLGAGFRLFT
jgi:hypothetical protein